mmetsp:Transcript_26997/g.53932  ORF Transcript_26997/g.53932 Transcript_26997/m.53932 type:complete len:90 (+) Transcript_26997:483-752(+)
MITMIRVVFNIAIFLKFFDLYISFAVPYVNTYITTNVFSCDSIRINTSNIQHQSHILALHFNINEISFKILNFFALNMSMFKMLMKTAI